MKLQSCGVVLLCLLICSSCVSEKENAPQSSNQTQVQSQNEKTDPNPIEQVESNSAPSGDVVPADKSDLKEKPKFGWDIYEPVPGDYPYKGLPVKTLISRMEGNMSCTNKGKRISLSFTATSNDPESFKNIAYFGPNIPYLYKGKVEERYIGRSSFKDIVVVDRIQNTSSSYAAKFEFFNIHISFCPYGRILMEGRAILTSLLPTKALLQSSPDPDRYLGEVKYMKLKNKVDKYTAGNTTLSSIDIYTTFLRFQAFGSGASSMASN